MQPNWLPNLCNNQYFFNYSYLLPKCLQSWSDSWAVCRATGQAQWTLFITLTGKLSQLHFIIAVAGNWKSARRVGKRQRRIHNLNVIIRKSQIRFVLVFGFFFCEGTQLQYWCLKVSLLLLVQQKNSLQERRPFSKEHSSATDCSMSFWFHLFLVHYKSLPAESWTLLIHHRFIFTQGPYLCGEVWIISSLPAHAYLHKDGDMIL